MSGISGLQIEIERKDLRLTCIGVDIFGDRSKLPDVWDRPPVLRQPFSQLRSIATHPDKTDNSNMMEVRPLLEAQQCSLLHLQPGPQTE